MRAFTFVLTFTIAMNCLAIRVVGNGGGEAELKLQQQYESLSVWIKLCSENIDVCFLDAQAGAANLNRIVKRYQQIREIQFTNQTELPQNGSLDTLFISHESLYIDDKTPKTDLLIFQEGLSKLVNGPQATAEKSDLGIRQVANGTRHPRLKVAFLKAESNDLLLTLESKQNLHQELSQAIRSSTYQVLSTTAAGYLVKNLSDNLIYEVYLQEKSPEGYLLKVLFRSDD